MMQEQFVKLILIGDSGVGKTCILKRYIDNKFTTSFYNTIGVQFSTKQITLDGKKCKLQIWDTAGQERFRSITSHYFKGAQGILIVFDVTEKQSFSNLSYWLGQADQNVDSVRIIIGNKCDEIEKRVISEETALGFAQKNNLQYIETSALNAANISLVFETIARRVLRGKGNARDSGFVKRQIQKNKEGSQKAENGILVQMDNPRNKVKNQCC